MVAEKGSGAKKSDDASQKTDEKKKIVLETILWRAAEYDYSKKSLSWVLSVFGTAIAGSVLAFIFGNFFFGLFLIGAGALVVFLSKQRPQICEFKISEEGIEVVGKIKMPFDSLKEFSVIKRRNSLDELVIRKRVNINPYVRIPIDSKLGEKAREMLLEKIPEVEYEEPIIDALSAYLGF